MGSAWSYWCPRYYWLQDEGGKLHLKCASMCLQLGGRADRCQHGYCWILTRIMFSSFLFFFLFFFDLRWQFRLVIGYSSWWRRPEAAARRRGRSAVGVQWAFGPHERSWELTAHQVRIPPTVLWLPIFFFFALCFDFLLLRSSVERVIVFRGKFSKE